MENNKYVVACINGVPPNESVCDYSSWLSQKLNKKLKLFHTLDHQSTEAVSDLSGNIGVDSRDELLQELVEVEHEQNNLLRKKAKIILEAAKRRVEKNAVIDPKLCLRHGRLLDNVLDFQNEIEALVIGRYGLNHQNSPEKSVGHKVEAVIRSLEKPILVVSKPFEEPTSVLLAFDGSPASEKALSYLLSQDALKELEVHVVHVGEKTDTSVSFLDRAVSRLQASFYKVQGEHLSGDTDKELMSYLNNKNICMTVMGAYGHHWLRNLLVGSFTSKMLSLSEKPLFLIR
jgi:nucleotide-binding universal stress UspA family protein